MPVPAGFPPDVFDGDVIEAVHINRVRDSVYLWPGNVDAGGYRFDNCSFFHMGNYNPGGFNTDMVPGGITVAAKTGLAPLTILHPVTAVIDWQIDTNGDFGSGVGKKIYGLGGLSFAAGGIEFPDLTTQTTAYKGVAANQTPWLQDVDAGGHSLLNVSAIAASAYYGGPFYVGGQVVLNAAQQFVGNGGVVTAGRIHTDGILEGNDVFAAAGLVGGSSGIFIKAGAGPLTQVIDASCAFLGPGGVFTAGTVIAKAPGEVWVMNTAGNAILARINGGGLVAGAGFAIEGGASGVSGTFTSANGKTITVTGGIITGIV